MSFLRKGFKPRYCLAIVGIGRYGFDDNIGYILRGDRKEFAVRGVFATPEAAISEGAKAGCFDGCFDGYIWKPVRLNKAICQAHRAFLKNDSQGSLIVPVKLLEIVEP